MSTKEKIKILLDKINDEKILTLIYEILKKAQKKKAE